MAICFGQYFQIPNYCELPYCGRPSKICNIIETCFSRNGTYRASLDRKLCVSICRAFRSSSQESPRSKTAAAPIPVPGVQFHTNKYTSFVRQTTRLTKKIIFHRSKLEIRKRKINYQNMFENTSYLKVTLFLGLSQTCSRVICTCLSTQQRKREGVPIHIDTTPNR